MKNINIKGISPNSPELAVYWLDQGYQIFPVGKDKKPYNGYKWGDYPITKNDDALLRWSGINKGAGVGIITGEQSNLLVLDVDNKNGANGDESIKILEKQYGSLPVTFKVKTPTGGYHYYFAYNNCGLTVDAGVMDGIDYRGEGGYVVAAGSVTRDGAYTIVCDAPVADAPDWLVRVLTRGNTNDKSSKTASSSGFLATGSRNNDLTSLAGSMRRKGMEQDAIETSLLAINPTLDQPLPEHEVIDIAKSIMRYPAGEMDVYATEQDFAEYLAKSLDGNIRYAEGLRFLTNHSSVWKRDGEGLKIKRIVQEAASKACEELAKVEVSQKTQKQRKAIRSISNKLKSNAFQNNVISMLKSHPVIFTQTDDLDTYQHIIGMENGVFDLDAKTFIDEGELYLVTRNMNVTYDPNADCPVFDQMMVRLFPDAYKRNYVMKTLGYALSGKNNLKDFYVWVGSGDNGKSTLIEAIASVFGDYSVTLDPSSLIRKSGGGIPNDIADLRGARLCVTSETSAGAVMDASLIKRLSGSDTITARYLYGEYFKFVNKAPIFLLTNYVPVFDGNDTAIANRVCIVQFDEVISEDEKIADMAELLYAERSGIFNRLIEAYELVKKEGLIKPECIKQDTAAFCDQSNLIKQFADEYVEHEGEAKLPVDTAYFQYVQWAQSSNYKPLSKNLFNNSFESYTQLEKARLSEGMVWKGAKLRKYVTQSALF